MSAISTSDLRWRSESAAWLLKAGTDVGANGLLGRLRRGNGVALFSQIDPDQLQADTKTYLRFTRWRQTRALSQLLANLGAGFSSDKNSVSLTKPEAGFYHPDYRADVEKGDDPYRYFRWQEGVCEKQAVAPVLLNLLGRQIRLRFLALWEDRS